MDSLYKVCHYLVPMSVVQFNWNSLQKCVFNGGAPFWWCPWSQIWDRSCVCDCVKHIWGHLCVLCVERREAIYTSLCTTCERWHLLLLPASHNLNPLRPMLTFSSDCDRKTRLCIAFEESFSSSMLPRARYLINPTTVLNARRSMWKLFAEDALRCFVRRSFKTLPVYDTFRGPV